MLIGGAVCVKRMLQCLIATLLRKALRVPASGKRKITLATEPIRQLRPIEDEEE